MQKLQVKVIKVPFIEFVLNEHKSLKWPDAILLETFEILIRNDARKTGWSNSTTKALLEIMLCYDVHSP